MMARLLWLRFLVVDRGCPNNARVHGLSDGVPEISTKVLWTIGIILACGLAILLDKYRGGRH
jgi:hypothetical protein